MKYHHHSKIIGFFIPHDPTTSSTCKNIFLPCFAIVGALTAGSSGGITHRRLFVICYPGAVKNPNLLKVVRLYKRTKNAVMTSLPKFDALKLRLNHKTKFHRLI